jgi:K+-transporting ATPase c subunit
MEVMVTTEVTVTYEKRTYENEKPLLSSFVTAVKPSDAMDSKTIGEKNDAAKSKVAKKRKKFKNKKKGKVDGDKMEASGSGIDTAANGGKEDVHVGSSGLAGEVRISHRFLISPV